jgi:regulator of cell morphogenesis and NO signaling
MNPYRLVKYRPDDILSDLVSENYNALSVLSRFGMTTGFGDKSIAEVCRENNVDTDTFLAIVNLTEDHTELQKNLQFPVVVPVLIEYLRNSHSYFIEYRFPEIREKLIKVLNREQNELNKAVLDYFDQLVAAVRKHMLYENKKVFPAVLSDAKTAKKNQYKPDFNKQHDHIESRWTEFKNILIKYYPAKITNELSSVLFAVFHCERDLEFHNAVEDHLFLPAISGIK